MSSKAQKLMVQPITILFRHLQQQTRVSLWLYDNLETRIEGRIVGFDEFMNVVISEAEEVYTEKCRRDEKAGKIPGARKDLGRILLKGDNITLIQPVV